MQKIVLNDLPRTLQVLIDDNSVQVYYSEDSEDFFIVCATELIKKLCMSMGILTQLVGPMTDTGLKFKNVFVIAGLIYSADQMTRLSIASYKKAS